MDPHGHGTSTRRLSQKSYSEPKRTGTRTPFRFLFPVHLNFHGEHHLNPGVPHYNLPQFAKFVESSELEPKPVRVTLHENFGALFSAPSSAPFPDS
ncbi:MAG: fatty acid desaturase [Bdellovibrionales bacterium]|nr:fatty acid desaturase [Bdellovibrionales bacterium]